MDYVPDKRSDFYRWLKGISKNAAEEAAKIGAPADEGTALQALADDITAKMDATEAAATALEGVRSQERLGKKEGLKELRAIIRRWKTMPGYPQAGTERVLAIKGKEPPFEAGTYQPVIKASLKGGLVRLDFAKLGVDALLFFVRLRGETEWRRLAVDADSPCIDATPLGQPHVPEVREYRAIGMIGDETVGQYSDIVSITVA
jgi:hypothetical protein